jgi:hypothetical protein
MCFVVQRRDPKNLDRVRGELDQNVRGVHNNTYAHAHTHIYTYVCVCVCVCVCIKIMRVRNIIIESNLG